MNMKQVVVGEQNSQSQKDTVGEIKEMMNKSSVAEYIFKDLDQRKRFSRSTNLEAYVGRLLKLGVAKDRQEVVNVFYTLQELGYGVIVHGRHGRDTTFEWRYNLRYVGALAVGKATIDAIPEIIERRVQGRKRKKRGRPFGSRTKQIVTKEQSMLSKPINKDIMAEKMLNIVNNVAEILAYIKTVR